MKIRYAVPGFLFLKCLLFQALSQQIQIDETIAGKNLPQINYVFNRIFGNISSFYEKLQQLKKSNNDVVRVVHIGDSHIQADLFTSVVRDSLQKIFGNAGRGLVFPYQVAGTNAPRDITSTSNITWQISNLTHPSSDISPGISGYCIHTEQPEASINFMLNVNEQREQTFDKLKFFLGKDTLSSWIMRTATDAIEYPICNSGINFLYEINLNTPANNFMIVSDTSVQNKYFYGVSLEKNQPGIIYHSIGVNGARYDQYNSDSLFWKQLPALEADIFIVSMGTNEAQNSGFNETAFLAEVSLFINNLKKANPGVPVLITTTGDSFKGRYSNKVLRQLNKSLYDYCLKNNIGIWDLYRVTNGYGSAPNWYRRGLLNRDGVHYTKAGYELQANLFFIALLNGYNNYTSTL